MRVILSWFVVLINSCAVFAQVLHDNANVTQEQNAAPFAVIAGGSKGIGYAIAEAWAKRNYNLVLIARHEDALQKAKQTLQDKYHIQVHLIVKDLSKEESAEEIGGWCSKNNIAVKALCNVAGMGGNNDYLSLPLDSLRYMVNLNVESCMALTLTLLPLLEKNAPSYILNVASMAGYAPIPEKNMYAATKSAVISFSYGLRYQLKSRDISVSCLTPGPVFTKPSIEQETKRQLGSFGKAMAVKPSKVGEIAVKKTLRGKMMITPGTLASINASVIRFLPKRLTAAFYHKVGKKSKQVQPEATAKRK
jgi:uncharacterized protein